MNKALKTIAIIMPFVVFVLFFLPSYTMIHDFRDAVESGSITIEEGSAYQEYNSSVYNVCAGYVSNIDYLVENGDAFLEEQVISNLSSLRTSLACTIAFFIIAVGFSVAIAFFSRKHPLMCCLNIVSSSFFWVWTLAVLLHIPYPVGVLPCGIHRICGQVAESASCEHSSPRAPKEKARRIPARFR